MNHPKRTTVLKTAALVLSLFNLTMFFAMRPCWSGISKALGYTNGGSGLVLHGPVYFCVVLLVIGLSCVFFGVRGKGNRWPVVYTALGCVMFAGIMAVLFMGAIDYIHYIWPNFLEAAAIEALAFLVWWLVFAYPESRLRGSKAFRWTMLTAAILMAGLILTRFGFNTLAYEPVVYAVEHEYQIVFSGSNRCTGWVTVDGVDYYDTTNGTMTTDRVHKVSVPMAALDTAKSYEIHLQRVIYRGPFGGLMGGEISKVYSFRPVDCSDGLRYLSFSDIHLHGEEAISAAAGEDIDFLVMNGDITSMVDRFDDANYCNRLCFSITHGEIPVVYARGNHETKGGCSDQLSRYVGSKNGSFFYNFYLDDVYGTVLDLGEDHEDDWWEYYGTAHYDDYRQQQVEFLQQQISEGDYEHYSYRLAVCHIPLTFVNQRGDHAAFKDTFTDLLNTMGTDMLLCGHQHELLIFEPGLVEPHTPLTYNPAYKSGTYDGWLTDFRFPSLAVSKPGRTQTDKDTSSHIGLLVQIAPGSDQQECRYLNSEGKAVPVVNPFAQKDYGEIIRLPLNP